MPNQDPDFIPDSQPINSQVGASPIQDPDFVPDTQVRARVTAPIQDADFVPDVPQQKPLDNTPNSVQDITIPSVAGEKSLLSNDPKGSTLSSQTIQPPVTGIPPETGPVNSGSVSSSNPDEEIRKAKEYGQSAQLHKDTYNKQIWDRDWIGQTVKNSELDQIATKYHVDPSKLHRYLPIFGGEAEDASVSDIVSKWVNSTAGEGVGQGLGPKLAMQLSGDERTQKALDEVRTLAAQRKSLIQTSTEIAAGFLVPVGKLAKAGQVVKNAVVGAGLGAVGGYGQSRTGEELKSTVIGTGAGAVLGGALGYLGRGAQKEAQVASSEVSSRSGAVANQVEPKPTSITNPLISHADHVESITPKTIQGEASKLLESRKDVSELMFNKLSSGDVSISPEEAISVTKKYVDESSIAKHLDPSTDEGALLLQKFSKENGVNATQLKPAVVEAQLGKQVYENQVIDFSNYLDKKAGIRNAEDASKLISKFQETKGGVENLKANWDEFLRTSATHEYIDTNGVRVSSGGILRDIGRKFEEGQSSTRNLEDLTGMRGAVPHAEWNQGSNLKKLDAITFNKDLRNVLEKYSSELKNPAISQEIHTPGRAQNPLSKVLLKVYQDAHDWAAGGFKETHPDVYWATPVESAAKVDSIPPQLVDRDHLTRQFESQIQLATKQASVDSYAKNLSKQELAKVFQTPAGKELRAGLDLMRFKNVQSGMQLDSAVSSLTSAPVDNYVIKQLGFGTDKKIPNFLQEKDTILATSKAVDGLLSKLYLDKPLQKMLNFASEQDAAGAKTGASYVRRFVSDTIGIKRISVPSIADSVVAKANKGLDQIDSSTNSQLVHGATNTFRVLGVLHDEAVNSAHATLTGMKSPVVIKHALSAAVRNFAEFSETPIASLEYMGRGYTRLAANMNIQVKKMYLLGLVPPESEVAIREGVQKSLDSMPIKSMSRDALKGVREALTYVLKKEYPIVKAAGYSVGEEIAEGLARGEASAFKLLKQLPGSVQDECMKLGYENAKKTSMVIGRHIGDVMATNYTKQAQSELVRTVGTSLGMFQKWGGVGIGDAARLGQLIQQGKYSKATSEIMFKWAAPFVAIEAIQHQLLGPKEKWSARTKLAVGGAGLEGTTSLGLVKENVDRVIGHNQPAVVRDSPLPFRILSAPAVRLMYDTTIGPLLDPKRDQKDLGKEYEKNFAKAIETSSPVVRWFNFFLQDLPTYIGGERMEGKDFTERDAEGVQFYKNKLNK